MCSYTDKSDLKPSDICVISGWGGTKTEDRATYVSTKHKMGSVWHRVHSAPKFSEILQNTYLANISYNFWFKERNISPNCNTLVTPGLLYFAIFCQILKNYVKKHY